MLHNTTEGLGVVAPIASDKPSLKQLAGLGAIAGVPTIAGALLGGLAYSPFWAVVFLSIGAGAIAQVVFTLYGLIRKSAPGPVWTPATAAGVAVGFAIMYGTGLLVAA